MLILEKVLIVRVMWYVCFMPVFKINLEDESDIQTVSKSATPNCNWSHRGLYFQPFKMFVFKIMKPLMNYRPDSCLTDFQMSQTEIISASLCPTDWPHFEHCIQE